MGQVLNKKNQTYKPNFASRWLLQNSDRSNLQFFTINKVFYSA